MADTESLGPQQDITSQPEWPDAALTTCEPPAEQATEAEPEGHDDEEDILSEPLLSRRRFVLHAASTVAAFGLGLGVGYWQWGRTLPVQSAPVAAVPADADSTLAPTPQPAQPALPQSYTLPVAYGQIGPQLIRAGAFALDAFVEVYAKAGQPLTAEQQEILSTGSDQPIIIDHANAYFLLNLLWAVGLTNNNPVLREGTLITASEGQVDRFASTGGWSLAQKPIQALYSGSSLVTLAAAQQARVEEAAAAIYRPCCNNPTSFPDCNHGMAMLGLLELMAAVDVDVDAMLEAAKMVNSFWFPTQSRELAHYYQAQARQDFASIPAREAVGAERFSGDGFAQVHNWLAANNKLEAPTQNGNSCGV